LDHALRTVQVTSPASSDGKTTTLVNLAVALARAGQRVIVVDCDLRRPRVHRFFGLEQTPGFTSVLIGDVRLSSAVQLVPHTEGIIVLASGQIPPNPSELLSSERASQIFASLEAQADVVLIDSPPVLPVADASVLGGLVDGTVVVASANRTHRKQVTRALELLSQVDAYVVGTVLNQVGKRTEYGDYSYEYKGAASEIPEHRAPGRAKTPAANGQNGHRSPEAPASRAPARRKR
ncbi:MAG: CpsD/CapB family tyrosine-protein kinase, partial [Actinobacteria bacterium]|nr:CpsD/CapB family tyrosine-protein kinase [Actinomycetota bacterium]